MIALAKVDGYGRARLRAALDVGAELAWQRCAAGCEPDGRRANDGPAWLRAAGLLDPDSLYGECEAAGVAVTLAGDDLHPHHADGDPSAAPLLFWYGQKVRRADALGGGLVVNGCEPPDLSGRASVAIVGTRRASRYGVEVAARLGRDLVDAGVDVVSGLALGIDAAAHSGALSGLDDGVNAIPIAVVASGVDVVHPQRNRAIWHGVAQHGVIVSEYPLGVRPAPWQFPERNRIIVAMSRAVVVVESHERGGSLLTAGFAADAGVPVLAVPGAVTSPGSLGTNRLLVDGCAPCLGAADVLDTLGLHTIPRGSLPEQLELIAPTGLEPVALAVWEAISWEGSDAGSLMSDTRLGFAAVSVALVQLQERRLIRAEGGVFMRQRT